MCIFTVTSKNLIETKCLYFKRAIGMWSCKTLIFSYCVFFMFSSIRFDEMKWSEKLKILTWSWRVSYKEKKSFWSHCKLNATIFQPMAFDWLEEVPRSNDKVTLDLSFTFFHWLHLRLRIQLRVEVWKNTSSNIANIETRMWRITALPNEP